METIDIVIIKEDCRVIDVCESDFFEENQDEYPYNWDETEVVTVPKKDWEEEKINITNYKKYIV